MNRAAYSIAVVALTLAVAIPARGQDDVVKLTIKDHRFEPAEVNVPAGRKIRLVVTNLDTTAEEFESHELNREKVIAAGATAALYIGPLAPGRYPFFGEFHQATARGVVVAE
jgi:plastocyanin